MIALIVLASVAAYLGMGLWVARASYQKIRPYTEPLGCDTPSLCSNGHKFNICHRRWGMVDTRGEAAGLATLWGLLWPLVGLIALVLMVVTTTTELPEERAAKIERMERENGL